MERSIRRNILFLLFFASGFTGLIYESLWSHYLKLFLGHSASAQTLVLIIFMGGLAGGAALAGRYGERLPNLLRIYGVVEIGVGILALGFHPLFVGIIEFSFVEAIPRLASGLLADAYRFLVAVALLLPPSLLLGMTFPLMSGAVLRRFPGQDGKHLATLYFVNSLGAALGVLAASFVLIGQFGLPGTMRLAGIANLFIGAVALWLTRLPENAPAGAQGRGGAGERLSTLLFVASAVTGAASFIYEVAWIRMLSLVLGSTFHAFELMLSAFITGLAFGGLLIRRWIDRLRNPLVVAAAIQMAMGVLALATLPIYGQSFDWMGRLVNRLPQDDDGYLLFNLASHGIAFAVMLPATLLAGMTLPLFTHALLKAGHGERSIGRVYALNTLGAIAGVVFAVQVGLPFLGLKTTVAAGALLDIALGVLLAAFAGLATQWRLSGCVVLLLPFLAVYFMRLDTAMLSSGVYRTGKSRIEGNDVVYYRDGKTATVTVSRTEGSRLALANNGKPDASIELDPARPPASDEITQTLLAAMPLVFRPDARRAANIGFGSGLTTHVLLSHPGIEEVSTVEIEPAVIEGSRAFLPRVSRAYQDPRSRIHIDDAKSWFARHHERFDIIVSEPSDPWVSGVAGLFSEEFYRRIRDRLVEGGLLIQWLNLYELDIRIAASIVAALGRHFDDYAIYLTNDANAIIIATPRGRLPEPSPKIFSIDPLAVELERVGIRSLDDIALRRIGAASLLNPMLRAARDVPNSDYRPYVELAAPKARFLRAAAIELPQLTAYHLPLHELLDRPASRWDIRRLSRSETWRYQKIVEARSVAGALMGEAGVGSDFSRTVSQWRRRLANCADPDAMVALHDIALATLVYLDRRHLDALWGGRSWLSCSTPGSPAFERALAIYQAVAQRDPAAMLERAEAALDAGEGSVNWRRYMLEVALLGANAQGDRTAVERLWDRHGRRLYPDEKVPAEVALLGRYLQPGMR